MTVDADSSVKGLLSSMAEEADVLVARGAQLAERVLAQFTPENEPSEMRRYLNDCEAYQRKWSDAGMIGADWKGGRRDA